MQAPANKFNKAVRSIIDIANILLGVAIVVMAVLVFVKMDTYKFLFTYIFIGGGALNILTGIKFLMTDRKLGGIITIVIGAALLAVAYFTYISVV